MLRGNAVKPPHKAFQPSVAAVDVLNAVTALPGRISIHHHAMEFALAARMPPPTNSCASCAKNPNSSPPSPRGGWMQGSTRMRRRGKCRFTIRHSSCLLIIKDSWGGGRILSFLSTFSLAGAWGKCYKKVQHAQEYCVVSPLLILISF